MEIKEVMDSYVGVIKKYAAFEGRARRREFWMFTLCNVVICIAFGILSRVPGLGIVFSILSGLYSLAILVPSLAVGARRLHDTNRTALLLLLLLIPLVGAIILIVFFVQEGTAGSNQYGPNPKA